MPSPLRLVPLPPSVTDSIPKPIAAGVGLAAELPAVLVRLPGVLVMKGLELVGRYEELARTGAELLAGRQPAEDLAGEDDEERVVDAGEFADYPQIDGWGSAAQAGDGSPDVPPALVADPAAAPLVRAAHDRETPPDSVVPRADLPIEDYDSLSAAALRARVGALSGAQLRTVRDYEAAHAKRLTVLQLLERKIAAAQ